MCVNTELFQTLNLQSLPYFKGTPLVQSSGTGKTCMLLQLGNMAPLLYICTRNMPADACSGYPLPDLQLRTFLDRPTEISMQEKLAVFLAAWFEILAQDLEKLTHVEAKFNYLGQLNQYSDTNIKQKRQTFFHRVLQLAITKVPNGKSPPPPPTTKTSLRHISSRLSLSSLEQDHSHQMTCFWLVLLSTNSGASSLIEPIHYQYANGVVASLRHIGAHPLPTFVAIGFDLLCAERTSLDSAAQVASLNSIKLYGCPLWASLLPSEIDFWVTAKQKLLGADNYDGSIEQCFSVLASCLALRFVPIHSGSITLFGQQLSFLRNAVDHHMRMLTQVDPEGVLQVKSPSEPILAIAASFTMLPTPAKIAKDRQLSLELATKRYGSMLHTLNTLFLPSASIDLFRGTRGELMSCIAWMAAWDAIKLQELRQLDNQRAYNPATPSFSTDSNSNNIGLDSHARLLHQPVLLNKILVEMVQLDHAEQSKVDARIDKVCKMVSRCYDDAGTDIQAWTHFTHFDVLNNNLTQISPEFLWHCWKRGVALRMKSSQHGINGIIPVFIGNLDHKFSSQRQAGPAQSSSNDVNTDVIAACQMSYVAWEAKYQTRAQRNTKLTHDPLLAGPELMHLTAGDEALTKRGLLTILLDLAALEGEPCAKTIFNTGSVSIWIRGITQSNKYPCLDHLGIRKIFTVFLQTVQSREMQVDRYNSNPLDNDVVFPHMHTNLDSQVAAADDGNGVRVLKKQKP